MSHQFFPKRSSSRRFGCGGSQKHPLQSRPPKPPMNFTDNFIDFPPSLNSKMLNKTRGASIPNQSVSKVLQGQTPLSSNNLHSSTMMEKTTFSSLFTKANAEPMAEPLLNESLSSLNDDDGVYLQISNLGQWYDEGILRNYLVGKLKPITPILSLTIETPSIARVKVPSIQFAKQVISHLHRKKMDHKRIFVSFIRDKTSAECSALRNKVAGLLKDVPTHQLPMSKFRELFQSRFKSSISILDLYRMPEICSISVNSNEEKFINLLPEVALEQQILVRTDQHSAPYCIHHFKADKSKGWAEIEISPLPNVMMTIAQVHALIVPLLRIHQDDIPIASLLYCLEAELNATLQANDRGVPLEHLVSCVPGVIIKNNDYGIKVVAWRDDLCSDDAVSSSKCNVNLSYGEAAENISKEVIELVKLCPKSTMMFSKFIPTYHNHFGKQCRVADYGCTKLIELFETMSSVVQILGDGETRQITLTHQTQLRRFSSDVFKILRAQANKSLYLSMLAPAYLAAHNRVFDVTDYGVCDIQDLLDGLRNSNFIMVSKKRDESDDACFFIQKRRQTNAELEKTSVFAAEVVELLRNAPQYTIPFRKFVRSYHYYFGYQCKLSDYGFMRLAELLEALAGVVEMDQNNEENRKIFFSRKIALRVFSEQIQEIIKDMTGKPRNMVKLDDVMEAHKDKYGYQMQGSSLGYDSVIDALKFVPFVELSSHENELWIVSHLESEKFRQRAMLACLAIVDMGSKVPLAKFHAVFGEKFNFNINEKTLHAMKHAVEIEMVNGVKMISITQMMKFFIHVVNIVDQRKKASISEIKSSMKLSLSTTFNFGFPNLKSLFQAFGDIFVVLDESIASEKGVMERCEVAIHPECPLIPSGLKVLLANKKVQLHDESPEIFKKPMTKTNISPIGLPLARRCITKPSQSVAPTQPKLPSIDDFYHRNGQFSGNQHWNNNPFAMGFADTTLSTTMPTELMNHPPYQQQRYASQFEDAPIPNQSLIERNLKFQHQQQLQALKRDFYNSSGMSANGSTSLPPYETNLPQQYPQMSPFSSFCNRFDPPKPDTPPLKPLWLDPVWNCDGSFPDNRAGNPGSFGQQEPLRGFNFQVVSPFLSFKTMFTFDNSNFGSNGGNPRVK